jgi:hypothetical protein
MSTVEIAVRKVKKMSPRQAKELLGWLAAKRLPLSRPARNAKRKISRPGSMKELKAWHASVRGTTDWEPPRLPDDSVKTFRF